MDRLALRPPFGLKQGGIDSIVRAHYGPRIVTMRPFDTWEGLYQDPLGMTPVTDYGQPVGLALDMQFSLRRGEEEVVNGSFDAAAASWRAGRSGVLSMNGDKLRVTMSNSVNAGGADQQLTFTPGRVYELTIDVGGFSGNITGYWLRIGQRDIDQEDGSTFFVTESRFGPGLASVMFIPTTPYGFVFLQAFQAEAGDGAWIDFKSVSVREVPGQHWSQPNVQCRPATAFHEGRKCLSFDGVDDFLRAFPPLLSNGEDYTFAAMVQDLSNLGQYQVPFGFLDSSYQGGFQIVNQDVVARTYSESIFDGGALQASTPPLRGRGMVPLVSSQAGRQALFKVDQDRGENTAPADKRLVLAANSSINGRADLFDLVAPMRLGGIFLAQGHGAADRPYLAERWARERKVLSLDDQVRGAFAGTLVSMRAFNTWEGLYQDPYGSVPVTAAGQPVALAIDQNTRPSDRPRISEIVADIVASTLHDERGTYFKGVTTGQPDPYFGHVYSTDALGSGLVLFEVEVWGDREMDGALYIYDQFASIAINEVSIQITTTPTKHKIIGYVPSGVFIMRVDGPDSRLGGSTPVGAVFNWRPMRAQFLVGTHWAQPEMQRRPITKESAGKRSIVFDGVDDFLKTVAPLGQDTDTLSVVASFQKLSITPATDVFFELGESTDNQHPGSTLVFFPGGSNAAVAAWNPGGGQYASSTVPLSTPECLVATTDFGAPSGQQMRLLSNAGDGVWNGLFAGAGNMAKAAMNLMARPSANGLFAHIELDSVLIACDGDTQNLNVARRWAQSKQA